MQVNCKICGKRFYVKQSNYKYCSKECSNVGQRIKKYEWNRSHPEQVKLFATKSRFKKRKPIICKICGDEVISDYGSRRFHDDCVLKAAHNKYCIGKYDADVIRAFNYGFRVEEIKQGVNEYETDT